MTLIKLHTRNLVVDQKQYRFIKQSFSSLSLSLQIRRHSLYSSVDTTKTTTRRRDFWGQTTKLGMRNEAGGHSDTTPAPGDTLKANHHRVFATRCAHAIVFRRRGAPAPDLHKTDYF